MFKKILCVSTALFLVACGEYEFESGIYTNAIYKNGEKGLLQEIPVFVSNKGLIQGSLLLNKNEPRRMSIELTQNGENIEGDISIYDHNQQDGDLVKNVPASIVVSGNNIEVSFSTDSQDFVMNLIRDDEHSEGSRILDANAITGEYKSDDGYSVLTVNSDSSYYYENIDPEHESYGCEISGKIIPSNSNITIIEHASTFSSCATQDANYTGLGGVVTNEEGNVAGFIMVATNKTNSGFYIMPN